MSLELLAAVAFGLSSFVTECEQEGYLRSLLQTSRPKEKPRRRVHRMKMRFGLEDDSEHTLEEVGRSPSPASAFARSKPRLCASCASLHAPASSDYFSITCTNSAAGETYTQREPRKGMAQHLRLDLRSLTAMRYTVASLRCVPLAARARDW